MPAVPLAAVRAVTESSDEFAQEPLYRLILGSTLNLIGLSPLPAILTA